MFKPTQLVVFGNGSPSKLIYLAWGVYWYISRDCKLNQHFYQSARIHKPDSTKVWSQSWLINALIYYWWKYKFEKYLEKFKDTKLEDNLSFLHSNFTSRHLLQRRTCNWTQPIILKDILLQQHCLYIIARCKNNRRARQTEYYHQLNWIK